MGVGGTDMKEVTLCVRACLVPCGCVVCFVWTVGHGGTGRWREVGVGGLPGGARRRGE